MCLTVWRDWTSKSLHKGGIKELPTGVAQNATVCKVCSHDTEEWEHVLFCWVAYENVLNKPSYSAKS